MIGTTTSIQDLYLLAPTSFCRAYNIFAYRASINSFCRRTACRIVFLATYGLSRWVRPLSSSPIPHRVNSAQGSGPQYSPGSIHLFPSRGTPLYPGGGEKDQRKRRDKYGSEARNGSKVPRLVSCSIFSVLSKPDRKIFKSFAGFTTAVGRIAMT